MLISALAGVLATVGSPAVPAATRDEPLTPEALVCQLQQIGSATAEEGAPFQTGATGDEMKFTIASIKIEGDGGEAQFVGNQGASTVFATRRGNLLTFLEFTPAGNLASTSVLLLGPTEAFPVERFPAVHSRHIVILSDFVVSQYVGSCETRY